MILRSVRIEGFLRKNHNVKWILHKNKWLFITFAFVQDSKLYTIISTSAERSSTLSTALGLTLFAKNSTNYSITLARVNHGTKSCLCNRAARRKTGTYFAQDIQTLDNLTVDLWDLAQWLKSRDDGWTGTSWRIIWLSDKHILLFSSLNDDPVWSDVLTFTECFIFRSLCSYLTFLALDQTIEVRDKKLASHCLGVCGGARERSLASNGQVCILFICVCVCVYIY